MFDWNIKISSNTECNAGGGVVNGGVRVGVGCLMVGVRGTRVSKIRVSYLSTLIPKCVC